jgi:hypothetical protein
MRHFVAAGRADAEPAGTHTETAAAAAPPPGSAASSATASSATASSATAGSATAAHTASSGLNHLCPPGQIAVDLAK